MQRDKETRVKRRKKRGEESREKERRCNKIKNKRGGNPLNAERI